MISYDESKRQINLKKHHIDLAECVSIFDYPMITKEDARENYGEQQRRLGCRFLATQQNTQIKI